MPEDRYSSGAWEAGRALAFAETEEAKIAILSRGENNNDVYEIANSIRVSLGTSGKLNENSATMLKDLMDNDVMAPAMKGLLPRGASREEFQRNASDPLAGKFGYRGLPEQAKSQNNWTFQDDKDLGFWKVASSFATSLLRLPADIANIPLKMAGVDPGNRAEYEAVIGMLDSAMPVMNISMLNVATNASRMKEDAEHLINTAYETNVRMKESSISLLSSLIKKKQGGTDWSEKDVAMIQRELYRWDKIKDLKEAPDILDMLKDLGGMILEDAVTFAFAEATALKGLTATAKGFAKLVNKADDVGRIGLWLEGGVGTESAILGRLGWNPAKAGRMRNYLDDAVDIAGRGHRQIVVDTVGPKVFRGMGTGSIWGAIEYGSDMHEKRDLWDHTLNGMAWFAAFEMGLGGGFGLLKNAKISGRTKDQVIQSMSIARAGVKKEVGHMMNSGAFKNIDEVIKFEDDLYKKFLGGKKPYVTQRVVNAAKRKELEIAAERVGETLEKTIEKRKIEYSIFTDKHGFDYNNYSRIVEEANKTQPIFLDMRSAIGDMANRSMDDADNFLKELADLLKKPMNEAATVENLNNGTFLIHGRTDADVNNVLRRVEGMSKAHAMAHGAPHKGGASLLKERPKGYGDEVRTFTDEVKMKKFREVEEIVTSGSAVGPGKEQLVKGFFKAIEKEGDVVYPEIMTRGEEYAYLTKQFDLFHPEAKALETVKYEKMMTEFVEKESKNLQSRKGFRKELPVKEIRERVAQVLDEQYDQFLIKKVFNKGHIDEIRSNFWKMSSYKESSEAYGTLSDDAKEILDRAMNTYDIDISDPALQPALKEIRDSALSLFSPEAIGGLPKGWGESATIVEDAIVDFRSEFLKNFEGRVLENMKESVSKETYGKFLEQLTKKDHAPIHGDINAIDNVTKDTFYKVMKMFRESGEFLWNRNFDVRVEELRDAVPILRSIIPIMSIAREQKNLPALTLLMMTHGAHKSGGDFRNVLKNATHFLPDGKPVKLEARGDRIAWNLAAGNRKVFDDILNGATNIPVIRNGVETSIKLEAPDEVKHLLESWDMIRHYSARLNRQWDPTNYKPKGYHGVFVTGKRRHYADGRKGSLHHGHGKRVKYEIPDGYKYTKEELEKMGKKVGEENVEMISDINPYVKNWNEAETATIDLIMSDLLETTTNDVHRKSLKMQVEKAMQKYGREMFYPIMERVEGGTPSKLHLSDINLAFKRRATRVKKFQREEAELWGKIQGLTKGKNKKGDFTTFYEIHDGYGFKHADYKPVVDGKTARIVSHSLKRTLIQKAKKLDKTLTESGINKIKNDIDEIIYTQNQVKGSGKAIRFRKKRVYNLPSPADLDPLAVISSYEKDLMNEMFTNPIETLFRDVMQTDPVTADFFRKGWVDFFDQYFENVSGKIFNSDVQTKKALDGMLRMITGKEVGVTALTPLSRAAQATTAIQATLKLGGPFKGLLNLSQLHLPASRIGMRKVGGYINQARKEPEVMRNISEMFALDTEIHAKMRSGEYSAGSGAYLRSDREKKIQRIYEDLKNTREFKTFVATPVKYAVGTGAFDKGEGYNRALSIFMQASELDAARGLKPEDVGSLIGRIKRGQTLSWDEEIAVQTWNVMDNFIYDKTNAPKLFWGPAGRGAGLFRTYGLNYSYNVWDIYRNAAKAVGQTVRGQALTAAERQINADAMKRAGRWMFMLGAMGGLKAIPIVASVAAMTDIAENDGRLWDVVNYGLPTQLGMQMSSTLQMSLAPEFDRKKWAEWTTYLVGGVNANTFGNFVRAVDAGDRGFLGHKTFYRAWMAEHPILKRQIDAAKGTYFQPFSPNYQEMKMDNFERIYSALGFLPMNKFKINEIKTQAIEKMRERSGQLKTTMQKAYDANKRGDFEEYSRIMQHGFQEGIIKSPETYLQYMKEVTTPYNSRKMTGQTLLEYGEMYHRVNEFNKGYSEDAAIRRLEMEHKEAVENKDAALAGKLMRLIQSGKWKTRYMERKMYFEAADYYEDVGQSDQRFVGEVDRKKFESTAKRMKKNLDKTKDGGDLW